MSTLNPPTGVPEPATMSIPLGRPEWRKLRILIVATLVILTVQGWFGDTTNLFVPFPTGTVDASLNGILQAIYSAGVILVFHAFEGVVLVALSVAVLALSIKAKPRSVRICAILGLVMMVSAAIGGTLFVLSGFQNNGVSAQMGGSFIGTYAFYFIELYYAK